MCIRDSYNALQYNFRFDEYFTQKDRLYLSYYNDSFDQQQPSPRVGLQALDIMRNRYAQADYTHTFSSKLLWENSFAFASVGGANGQDADLKVPTIAISDVSEGFLVGGGWGPGEYRGPMYNWRSVLSLVNGKHTLKFGFDGAQGIEHGNFTPYNVIPVSYTHLLRRRFCRRRFYSTQLSLARRSDARAGCSYPEVRLRRLVW